MTILLVEDNALQRRILEAQLQPLGHHVLVAANGEEALARIKAGPEPDMVIMDVVMPSLDGFKTCESLKADPATAGIPVLVLTALSRDAKDRSYAAGADDFLTKPLDVNAVLVVLSPQVTLQSKRIVELALKQRLPGMYPTRQFAEEGGLVAYGPLIGDLYRRAATYVDRILKGTKPADLPVEQPTKFELVINLKAAKQIGVTIPPNVLARADKVIK